MPTVGIGRSKGGQRTGTLQMEGYSALPHSEILLWHIAEKDVPLRCNG